MSRFKLAGIFVVLLFVLTIAPVQARQEKTLVLWTHEFPPLQDAMTNDLIPQFEAANPGIHVEMTAVPFAGVISYDTKLLADLSSGAGPDVWDMGSWDYTQ